MLLKFVGRRYITLAALAKWVAMVLNVATLRRGQRLTLLPTLNAPSYSKDCHWTCNFLFRRQVPIFLDGAHINDYALPRRSNHRLAY